MSMGYKKDIFGIFAYEFELLPKYLEFSNLVCGGEPPSVDQWLYHLETAYKNHRDLFFGIYRYAFEQLPFYRPCASAVRCLAFSADEQFGHGVFA